MKWLHLKKLPGLVGMVLRVEFLRPDGKPCYKRPIWLFWSGPETTLLEDLCRMYLWRFSIEHCFRFLKQHLGLHANQSKNLVSTDQWIGAALWFIGNYCSCKMLWKTVNLPGILHNLPLIPAKEHPVISPTCQIALRHRQKGEISPDFTQNQYVSSFLLYCISS